MSENYFIFDEDFNALQRGSIQTYLCQEYHGMKSTIPVTPSESDANKWKCMYNYALKYS